MDHNEALRSQACEKYLLGELSLAEREAYEEHYFSCDECAAGLRSAAEFLAVSRETLAQAPAAAPAYVPAAKKWLGWLRPALAIPAFALLLLILGYQNLVTIPYYRQASKPRVLPMHSLIAGNTRGEESLVFTAAPGEPLGLYVDIPVDSAHSSYLLRLEDPRGTSSRLRSVDAGDAQKTQVLVIHPTRAGKYAIVISGLANSSVASHASAEELARLEFVIELKN